MSGQTLHATLLDLDPEWQGRIAVKTPKGALTYGQMRETAVRLAGWLAQHGCRRGDRVAVCLPKSIDSVLAQLGTMLAGAAYVPVDPSAPAQRQATIANLADACRVITTPEISAALRETGMDLPPLTELSGVGTGAGVASLVAGTPAELPEAGRVVGAGDLAAILFTSGSTGTPKGVSLTHGNVLAFVDWTVQTFRFTAEDRLVSHAPFHFDLSTMDLYTSFRVGASVFILDEVLVRFPSSISKILESERITSWYSVPTALRLLEEKGALARRNLSALRQIFFAGEIFPVPALRKVMEAFPGVEFVNLYGPTETNVCTYYRMPGIPAADVLDVPIGRPCEHYDITIRDELGNCLGPGQSGEICVAGPGCTVGYWQRPDLTEKCRFDGREDSYLTGDFGYWLPDGNIRFQGRRDAQVKIRGHRVELMEVENVILTHPDIKEAAAVLYAPEQAEAELFAFVVPQRDALVDEATVYGQCSKFLPHYAEPHKVVVMEDFPRTSTGKIDRQGLKALCREYP
jgi:amino acid adenylation domain-containing protein